MKKFQRTGQKIGSNYPVPALLIAYLSFLPWILWLIFNPSLEHFIASTEAIRPFEIESSAPLYRKYLASLIYGLAAVLTLYVLTRSYVLRNSFRELANRLMMRLQSFAFTRNIDEVFVNSVGKFIDAYQQFITKSVEFLGTSLFGKDPDEYGRIRIVAACLFSLLLHLVGIGLLLIAGWFLTSLVVRVMVLVFLLFVYPILLPVLATGRDVVALVQSSGWSALSFDTFSPLKPFLWFLLHFWIGSSIILNGPLWLFKWLNGLGENNFLRRWLVVGRGASSRWAGPRTYDRLRHTSGDGGIFLGSTDILDVGPEFGRPVYLHDDGHLITIGCPGSGKSVTSIWPNLALYDKHVIVLDPKGEHARETYWYRNAPDLARAHGQKGNLDWDGSGDGTPRAFKLDPFNEEPSIPNAFYNPLSEIDVENDNVMELLSSISDGCVLPEGERNRHWTENAKTVIEGFIVHVLSSYPKENHNLPFVRDLITNFDPEFGYPEEGRLEEVLVAMQGNLAAGGICADAVSRLGERQGSAYASIMATVTRSIKWMGDPAMRKHLGRDSDFSMVDLYKQGHPKTLYIVAPIGEKMKEQVRWLRVLTNLGITVMRGEKGRGETLFILDEFARMGGSLSAITEGVTTLRAKKIKLWPFLQNISQLHDDYGAKANDFLEASAIQVFGVENAASSTAEWVSQLAGTYFHESDFEKSDERRILTPQEVVEVFGKNKDQQFVVHHGISFPMRLKRLAHKRIKNREGGFKSHPEMFGCFSKHRD